MLSERNYNQLKINDLKIAQPEIRAYADIARRLGQNQLRRGSLLTLGCEQEMIFE
jgi:propanediol dehydratase small subunit